MSRLVYGVHPVEEALRRRRGELQGIVVARRGELPPALAEAQSRGVPVQRVSAEELDRLCGASSHQGLAAIVGDYPYLEIEDLLAAEPAALLLILDSITDPQNLGAIIRSAAFLGATGLVLPKDRAAPITPVVVRVSAGASEHLRCARVTNLARALEQIKEAGIWVVGAVEKGGVAPEQIELAGPTALVLGNEQKGIRPLVLRGCDIVCTIPPPRSSIGSLNVAAAATALLHEASRQRRSS
jgi:23S rRNA (guanosine2251-2'-O)-methyltransferase